MLTYNLVKKLFYYKDGFLYWKIKAHKRINAGDKAGYLHIGKERRYRIYYLGKKYLASRLIFLFHKGYLPETVDHENRNSTDNRIENLRDATFSQNAKNKKSKRNSSSIYLGVSRSNKIYWMVQIKANGKDLYLGRYKDENEAALIYNKYAVMYHKEFANLNIIKPEIKKKTMIKLKLEFATGIEMREALEQLLNGSLVVTKITLPEPAIGVEKTAENFEDSKIEVVKDEKTTEITSTSIGASLKDVVEAAATVAKSKRKSGKVETVVAPGPDPSDNVPEGSDMQNGPTIEQANEGESETAQPKVNAVTAQMLQEKAVAEIRKGKKEDVVKIIKEFGGDSISQADKNPLKPEVYADVMDAFNKL